MLPVWNPQGIAGELYRPEGLDVRAILDFNDGFLSTHQSFTVDFEPIRHAMDRGNVWLFDQTRDKSGIATEVGPGLDAAFGILIGRIIFFEGRPVERSFIIVVASKMDQCSNRTFPVENLFPHHLVTDKPGVIECPCTRWDRTAFHRVRMRRLIKTASPRQHYSLACVILSKALASCDFRISFSASTL